MLWVWLFSNLIGMPNEEFVIGTKVRAGSGGELDIHLENSHDA